MGFLDDLFGTSSDSSDSGDILETAHNEGQAHGSDGGDPLHISGIVPSTAYGLVYGQEAADAYHAGYENGLNNPSKK